MSNLLTNYFILNGNEYKNYITVFGFDVKFYAIAIVTGMLVCMLLTAPLLKRINLQPDFVLDMMIAILPLCIICARLWYVIFELDSYDSFVDLINIRNGGLAIYGGVMGGALAVFIVSKIKKIPFLKLADICCALLPLGQAIGRWGNFFNQEVYGGITDITTFPFSVFISSDKSYHYALFFYECILNLILFGILYTFMLKKKKWGAGYSMSFYFIGYGLIRFILEQLRDKRFNLMLGSIRSQVLFSGIVILLGVSVLVILLIRDGVIKIKKNKEENKDEN